MSAASPSSATQLKRSTVSSTPRWMPSCSRISCCSRPSSPPTFSGLHRGTTWPSSSSIDDEKLRRHRPSSFHIGSAGPALDVVHRRHGGERYAVARARSAHCRRELHGGERSLVPAGIHPRGRTIRLHRVDGGGRRARDGDDADGARRDLGRALPADGPRISSGRARSASEARPIVGRFVLDPARATGGRARLFSPILKGIRWTTDRPKTEAPSNGRHGRPNRVSFAIFWRFSAETRNGG